MDDKLIKCMFCAVALLLDTAVNAVEFSKAGYWEAKDSPRRVETMTTGWEFSLDDFKTSKNVTLPQTAPDSIEFRID